MADIKTNFGYCRDCSQGSVCFPVVSGFALQSDGPQDSHAFWYCLYCGSNHVDIKDANGNVLIEQGDLYNREGELRA